MNRLLVLACVLSAFGCSSKSAKSACPESASIPLELPKAASGTSEVAAFVEISLTAQGAIYINGAAVDGDDAVRARVRDIVTKTTSPSIQAMLRIDQSVPYGRFISILDLVRQSGIARYALVVDPIALPPGAKAPPREAPAALPPPPAVAPESPLRK
jgi:biopolymer transport protein ExbD